MSRRTACIFFALVTSVCGCVALVAAAMFAAEQEQQRMLDTYGQEIIEKCDPPAGGVASPANMPAAPVKVLALNSDAQTQNAWHKDLPDELRADDKASVGAVICVGKEEQTIVETCEYTATGNDGPTTFKMERIQYSQQFILLNATTGSRIAETTLQGGVPAQCPESYSATQGSTQKQFGSKLTYNDFETALRAMLATE